MADGRHTPFVIQPLFLLREAPAAVRARLQASAQAEGYAQLPERVWCPHCATVWDAEDLIVGQVQGTDIYLPLCPTADCAGIGWLQLRDATMASQ